MSDEERRDAKTSNRSGTSAGFPQLATMSRLPLHEQVYLELRAALMKGRFMPGHRLPIRSLATALGTSEVPVREALRRLTAERALTVLPTGTAAVPVMTRSRFAELTDARVVLEGMATERAAHTLTGNQVQQLQKMAEKLRKAEARLGTDRSAFLELNNEFHFSIYRSGTHSDVILHIIETLWLQIGPFLNNLTITVDPTWPDYHGAVVDAFAKRDGRAARRAIELDISTAAEAIMEMADLGNDA